METPLYYLNKTRTAAAVSFDGGETLVLPDGRRVRWFNSWEEMEDDLRLLLSARQELALSEEESMEDYRRADPRTMSPGSSEYRTFQDALAAIFENVGRAPVAGNPHLDDLFE